MMLYFTSLSVSTPSAPSASGVVSGTTVRALVLGPYSQKIKKEFKDNAKMIKNISYHKGGG